MSDANGVHDARVRHVYLGLGSNLDDRLDFLNRALARIRNLGGTAVLATSPVYESRAHVTQRQFAAPDFLNAVVHIMTTLSPSGLLTTCTDLERELGRTRGPERWLPRTIDIDILVIDGMSKAGNHLILPHPRMHERRFVLQPLCDIDPNLHVPIPFDASVKSLLESCRDTSAVSLYADVAAEAKEWHRLSKTARS